MITGIKNIVKQFTIQNVSIKFVGKEEEKALMRHLQYKMFLLNTETVYR